MNANVYVIEDYENETAFRPKKTNPIQTQFTKGQNRLPENPATPPGLSALIYSFRCGIYIFRFLVLPHNRLENRYEQAHRFYPNRAAGRDCYHSVADGDIDAGVAARQEASRGGGVQGQSA
jgi:hypothetical protein